MMVLLFMNPTTCISPLRVHTLFGLCRMSTVYILKCVYACRVVRKCTDLLINAEIADGRKLSIVIEFSKLKNLRWFCNENFNDFDDELSDPKMFILISFYYYFRKILSDDENRAYFCLQFSIVSSYFLLRKPSGLLST